MKLVKLSRFQKQSWLIAGTGYVFRIFPYLNTIGYLLCGLFWFNSWFRFRRKVFIATSTLLVVSTIVSIKPSTPVSNVVTINLNVENPVELKVSLLNLIAIVKEVLVRNLSLVNSISLVLISASLLFEWFCLRNLIRNSVVSFRSNVSLIIVYLFPLLPVVFILSIPLSTYSLNNLVSLESHIVSTEATSLDMVRDWVKAFYRAVLPINTVSVVSSTLHILIHATLAYLFLKKRPVNLVYST